MDDVVIAAVQEYKEKGFDEPKEEPVYAWVPSDVLGEGTAVVEPPWGRLPQKSYLEFYNGLQRRNWTNSLHDAAAEPWKVTFFQVGPLQGSKKNLCQCVHSHVQYGEFLCDTEGRRGRLLLAMQDNGRLLGPSFNGYRAVVTPQKGRQFWVDMPKAGIDTWTADHLSGGTKGGLWRAKRNPRQPHDISELGYNHVRISGNMSV